MNRSVFDYQVILKPTDPRGLADARADHDRLERFFFTGATRSDARLLMRMGENLFRLAFPTDDDLKEFVVRFAEAVLADATLRLWLFTDDPEVAMLPWEYLCLTEAAVAMCCREGVDVQKYQPHTTLPDQRTFLALHPNVSLVRRAAPTALQADLEPIGVLRVLVVWANPGSKEWPDIDGIEAEVQSILDALRGLPASHCHVRVLVHATRGELAGLTRDWRPHVLHFAGHGGFPGAPDDPGDLKAPSLVLEGKHTPAGRRHEYLTADELRALCAESGVQVVVLNACWGARTRPHFPGIAYALTAPAPGAPVSAAVAHQTAVPQSAAVRFAAPFYQNLVSACSIEDGVRTFRADSLNGHVYGCGVPDWGIPVVFLGVRNSALFRTERIDPYPLNFGPLVQQHVPIVGRQFLRDEIQDFQKRRDRSILLITAVPGVGKTAFLAQWVNDDPELLHFFYRATVGVTDADECLRSLYQGLLGKYRTLEGSASEGPLELRSQLEELLRRVSAECERRGRMEVLVIDALDEAATAAFDGKSAVELLPRDLRPPVYLVVTSRPGPVADSLARRPDVTRFNLDPASQDNLRDAAAFCLRELDGRVTDADAAALERLAMRLAERARGNFLVLKLFLSKDSLGEEVSVDDLGRAAEHLTGVVEEQYEGFFQRVTRRAGDDLERLDLLHRVLSAFAVAQAPVSQEQVCAAFDLRSAHWQWAFERVSQFVERGGVRQEEGGALTYRLYHETFREFLLGKLAADLPGCHRRWAEHCGRWRDLDGYARLYALRYLPTHLIEAGKGA